MAVNIELNSESLKKESVKGSHIQFIPCNIEHDGEADIEKFFTTYVQETTLEDGKTKGVKGTLRGYPLDGTVMSVTDGYTGVVLKETRPSMNEDDERTIRGVCQFKEFTYWNLDREPGPGDKFKQAMNWMEIADAVHGY